MFAVATVIGPLIGGLCVTYLSWRWVFDINLPLGYRGVPRHRVRSFRGHLRKVHHRIDYLGTASCWAGSATSLILFASLGWSHPGPGPRRPAFSPVVLGVVLAVGFVMVERRAQ